MPPTIKLRLSVRGDTIKVKAGEPVNIPADVTGLPMPKIEWSKNETVIEKPTDALKITKEEVSRSEAKTELIIPKAVREDKGTYTITASNRLGSVFRNVHVEVYGKGPASFAQNQVQCLRIVFSFSSLGSFPDRPSPPRNLAVTDIKAESCYLTWDAPLDNGGSEITH